MHRRCTTLSTKMLPKRLPVVGMLQCSADAFYPRLAVNMTENLQLAVPRKFADLEVIVSFGRFRISVGGTRCQLVYPIIAAKLHSFRESTRSPRKIKDHFAVRLRARPDPPQNTLPSCSDSCVSWEAPCSACHFHPPHTPLGPYTNAGIVITCACSESATMHRGRSTKLAKRN